ncbi:hypothetical protein Tco_0719659 [Tanacetum coccineum]
MAIMTKNVLAAGAKNRPPMLEKGGYDRWKGRILLYIEGKENGEMLIDSINNDPFQFKEITIPATETTVEEKCLQKLKDLAHEEKISKSTELIIQERESKLYDDFERFTFEKGEWIHSYYLRYAKLLNDMNIINMKMTPIQISTKFVNHLQPEWSRFVTAAKQAKNHHKVNFDQLYAYLKQNENDANEVRAMRQRYPDPIALLANTYNLPPSYSRKGKATGTWVINTVGDVKANQPRLHKTSIFKSDHVDAFDSDCDEAPTASAIFMARLSPTGSINGGAFGSTYDLDILFEVSHYNTYHETNMLNHVVQEMKYSEHLVYNNNSYDELTSDSNVTFYVEYMTTIKNDAAQSVPPFEQDNAMILSVIKQMQSQVE